MDAGASACIPPVNADERLGFAWLRLEVAQGSCIRPSHAGWQQDRAGGLLRGELGQYATASRRQRPRLDGQASNDPAAAGLDAAAQRANIGAARRAQHEQLFPRQHWAQYQCRRGRRGFNRSGPCSRCSGATTDGGHGPLAGRRHFRPIFFPGTAVPERRQSARRHRPFDSRSDRRCGPR